MHEALHVGILASTLLGAAGLAVLVLWPLLSETPLPRATRAVLAAVVGLGLVLLVLEWRVVH